MFTLGCWDAEKIERQPLLHRSPIQHLELEAGSWRGQERQVEGPNGAGRLEGLRGGGAAWAWQKESVSNSYCAGEDRQNEKQTAEATSESAGPIRFCPQSGNRRELSGEHLAPIAALK